MPLNPKGNRPHRLPFLVSPFVFLTSPPHMQEEMKPRQYASFSLYLQACWGRNPYYERRSGKRSLPPVEQEQVRDALRHAGVPDNLEFDSYEYRINWTE